MVAVQVAGEVGFGDDVVQGLDVRGDVHVVVRDDHALTDAAADAPLDNRVIRRIEIPQEHLLQLPLLLEPPTLH